MKFLFWFFFLLILYVYLGYPLILWLISVFFHRKVKKSPIEPTVSILISAYNEEKFIGPTIENKLALDYPDEKREIIVVSDGSSDGTEDIVRSYSNRRVQLIVQNPRQGKTSALNRAVKQATGEILVFSDANSLYSNNALRRLVSNFSDPSVGYVTGKMVYVDEAGSLVGSGCSAYMRYENILRGLETKIGSVIGVDGGVDAIRRSLFQEMAPDMLPDFVQPLIQISNGFRVVYESEALLMESSLSKGSDEWKMRIRVALRSFHALKIMGHLLNPFAFPLPSFQLFSHKVLRYGCGFFQIALFLINTLLIREMGFYALLWGIQIVFYFLCLIGTIFPRLSNKNPFVKYPTYLCLLNAAAMLACIKFIKGEKQVIWEPRKG